MDKDAQNLPVTVDKSDKGRPTKYKPEYAQQIFKMALLGLTDEEIADIMGVSRSTFNLWKKNQFDFSDTVRRGKALADANVAASLYKRAVGYKYKSEKIVTVNNEVVRVPTTVVVIPDPGACMNWLKNRQPKKWRDKQHIEHSGTIKTDDLKSLTTEQLRERLAKLKEQKANE